MPVDFGHFAQRLLDPFNGESRFYWPAVIAVLASFVANIVWYNLRRRGAVAPAEIATKPWAFWINVITLIWLLVLLYAKMAFWLIALSIAVDIGLLVYMYGYWLPPREAAWVREQRRQQYFPRPEHRKKRRRR